MLKKAHHPMQPLEVDNEGVIRFKRNAIIDRLFNERIISLNTIAMWDVPTEDREQFWQLLGYSVSGYGDLSFVRKKTIQEADEKAWVLEQSKSVKK